MLCLASFGYDGDGFRERTAFAAAYDAFLVIDLNADGTRGAGGGQIDQRSELILNDWGPEGSTDLQALAEATDEDGNFLFDTNGDGVLAANDTSYGEFRVCQDLDQDGEAGALFTPQILNYRCTGLQADEAKRKRDEFRQYFPFTGLIT